MTTETKFPVDTGTTITVLCQDGWINKGSKTITCNTYKYGDFDYDPEPTCGLTSGKDGKFIFLKLESDHILGCIKVLKHILTDISFARLMSREQVKYW